MIYLNQAAGSWPKPEEVIETVNSVLSGPPASQYRSTAQGLQEDYAAACRKNLGELLGISDPARIFFTSGATEALNLAIFGVCRGAGDVRPEGRRKIVITQTEHNAVLRTVFDGLSRELSRGSLEVQIVPCDEDGYVDLDRMAQALSPDTLLAVTSHCSNVTGAVQDIRAIGAMARKAGALFLVDAAQSAGTVEVSAEEMNIDLLAFAGHKGLFGIQGTGGLYIRPGLRIRPLLYGGTGRDSEVLVPETPFYEVGTANMAGIAALWAGTSFLLRAGQAAVMEREKHLMKLLYEGLRAIPGVKVYAKRQPEGTVISFTMTLPASDVGYILAGSYGIIVRTGLHCAPLIHRAMGTVRQGTVRVSISYLTKEQDILALLEAVREIAEGACGKT